MASVSFITDIQQCYYMYTGRGEPARNNCRSLSVMLNFCGSHHRVRTRSTASGVQGDAKVHLSTLLCHLHVIVCVTQFRVIFHCVFLSTWCQHPAEGRAVDTDQTVSWLTEETRFHYRRSHEICLLQVRSGAQLTSYPTGTRDSPHGGRMAAAWICPLILPTPETPEESSRYSD